MDHITNHGFPLWLRINHFVNFLFLSLLVRSGIQILADHPKLYWNIHCAIGSEWIKFTKKKVIPKDGLWTSMDEAIDVSPWIALPGGFHNLGAGRHWHFFSVIFWLTNGLIYITLLFFTGEWSRLIPTSLDIIPRALHTFMTYLSFHLPQASEFRPYDPLQQLTYAGLIFVVTPIMILTGIAMSPAVDARYPWYPKCFGNRQIARSIHFILMVGYVLFAIGHVSLVVITGFSKNMNRIVLGETSGNSNLAVEIGLGAILLVISTNILLTWFTQISPRTIQIVTGVLVDPVMQFLFGGLTSRQNYKKEDISPYFWVNGRPPETDEYKQLLDSNFANWKLKVHGLVENTLELSLSDLHNLHKTTQTTAHHCIQGWTGIAEWSGVSLSEIIKLCKPVSNAHDIIFHSYDVKPDGTKYYGSLSIQDALHPQTILAYEMNGAPLPVAHGAPLRLRVETKLGFKMVKYLRSLEFVETYHSVGQGFGGSHEDEEYYGTIAGI